MNKDNLNSETNLETIEKIERGKRIKNIRENELHMNKSELAKELGISGQFLGLVEEGKGNLVYKSLKKLRNLSGHSSDFILYGLDDNVINDTKNYLKDFSDEQIIKGLELLKNFALLIKNN